MDFFITRKPLFNRKREVFGYKLEISPRLVERLSVAYAEQEGAEALYHRLGLAGFDGSPDRPAVVLDSDCGQLEELLPLLPREQVIVEFTKADRGVMEDLREIRKLKTRGYSVLYEAAVVAPPAILQLADFIKFDITEMNIEQQHERLKSGKESARYIAGGVDTWEDYRKALVIGYDFFQGDFYLKPLAGKQGGIKPLNTSVLRVMSALGQPEPSLKEITAIIEHDLNLSYNLLKRVNSAYVAPRFKVKTISQAVTILGLNALGAFVTSIMMKQIESPENTELLRLSLIRGKFMDLLAVFRNIPQAGSEAFFVGIFSLIDIILNKPMAEIIDELPVTDAVKAALLGGTGDLKSLLDMVRRYERVDWDEFDVAYSFDAAAQETVTEFYLMALTWAESFEY